MQHNQARSTGIIVVAAGRGERAGPSKEGPKQYRMIGGKPVIAHTLAKYLNWPGTTAIVVVIHPDDAELCEAALQSLADRSRVTLAHGGATRQASVLSGLRALALSRVDDVLIHDAVRPFFDEALLERVSGGLADGAACVLPAIAVTDTLKRATSEKTVGETVARARLFAAQTPQGFSFAKILDAHEAAVVQGLGDFTDDAAIAEWAGMTVHLVDGDPDNIKLTLQRDIQMADEKLNRSHLPDVRTGNGYDVHQLVEGHGVTLCGIFIAHDQMLKGHSDADVALHALTDALLATCGAGDIGDHFPPSDPQWRGAASRIFLAHAAKIVRDAGGTIMNADVSLIAEAPKIGPHRLEMREKLAEILGIALERCSVKATTNETIGFVGRREGIAAIATATVVFADRPS
ncbi:MAG: bifunctional 2-C-methyl-D-erythritol 4-phosphate cytidylyltransferase/2-C-methyl-D-erythritol 2,4-cyclodiphosphate synthase [Allorhizobium sp.]